MTKNQQQTLKTWLQYHAENKRRYIVPVSKKKKPHKLITIPIQYEVI